MASEAIQAGPALDGDRAFNERVARVVFGPPSQYPQWWWFNQTGIPLDENAALYAGPDFLHDWHAMGLVIERMRALGWGDWEFRRRALDGMHFVTFTSRQEGRYSAIGPHTGHDCPTLPHAVALAALAALEGRDA